MYDFSNKVEPFAVGFLQADRENVSYRIACGMLERAKHHPIWIRPGFVFAGYFDQLEETGVRYEFGNGIQVKKENLMKQMQKYPEYKDELKVILEQMSSWDTNAKFNDSLSRHERLLSEMRVCHGGDWGGHSNPNYLLDEGTDGIRKKIEISRRKQEGKDDFYDALLIALEALEVLAERYRQLALHMMSDCTKEDKYALQRIADALSNVPKNTPRDFFEACQMFWLVFCFDGNDSPGRFDMYMIDYYRMSEKTERLQCLEALWKLFHDTRTWNLCIGGSDALWNDESNELTYDILRVAKKYKFNTPNLTMRVHQKTPDTLLELAIETIGTGIGMPVLYNDECVCQALEELGIPAIDSHSYCMNGCNQIDIMGKSHMGLEDGEVCLAKCLELALYNGVCSISGEQLGPKSGDARLFTNYESLWNAYIAQVEAATDATVVMANRAQKIYAEYAPNPHRSNLIEGCIEKGQDYKNGGPIYGHGQILAEGIADTADSLYALKRLVFELEKYTMDEILSALKADFDGYEELYDDLRTCDKFGNDCAQVDEIYKEIVEHFYRYLLTKQTFRGGIYGGGCSPFNRVAAFGKKIGALPNGKRKASPLLADSVGAVPGEDVTGPTALLNSVACVEQTLAKSGHVLNMKFGKKLFSAAKGREIFRHLMQVYFANGGQQLSVSVTSVEELLDAQKNPEAHKNLIVRVGGYSDYFINLSADLQDNIIRRTEVL